MKSVRRAGAAALFVTTALTGARAWAQDNQSVDELVIVGQRLSQQRSIDFKRDAAGVADAISADEIGRLPDKNAAENVERLPGVSLKYDQGEGRYVAIRGVDGALNNVTVNGVELGSPDTDTRQLPLDVVSGQLLQRIEVVKAVTPDMDAQAIGGSINLVTQSPYDFKKAFFAQGTAQVGAQQLNGKKPVAVDATVGGLFGPDQKFGVILGANYSHRDYRTYGIYPDDWRPVAGVPRGLPTTLKYTTYNLDRERIGVTGALEYRPTTDDRFYLRGIYSTFKEDEYRQRYRIDFATDALIASRTFVINPGGTSGVSVGDERRQDLRLEKKDKTISSASFGGDHKRGVWAFDYDLSIVHNELDEPNQLWQFRGGSLTTDWDVGPFLYTVTPRQEAKPSDLGFRQVTYQANVGDEDIKSVFVNLRRDLAFGQNSFLKVGVKHRDSQKTQDNANDTYTRAATAANRFSLADFNLLGAPTATKMKGQIYFNNPTIDAEQVQAFTNQNLNGPKFVLDTATSLSNATLGDYEVGEKVTAGYAMANLNFGKLTVLGGVRIEHTSTDVSGFHLTNGTTVTKATGSSDYTNVLPSLHLRFEPSDKVVLRAAFTNTLGRPQYPQLAPSGAVAYTELTPGVFEGSLSEGNIDLKPYRAYNFDASAEWYFAKGGILSAGAFHKTIKDPIFTFSDIRTNFTLDGRTYQRFQYSQPRNADEAHVSGVEVSYQQQFTFLPGALSGFGVAANMTLTDSDLKVPDRATKVRFPKQSAQLYGLQLFYQKYGIEAVLSYHHTSSFQDTIGGTAATDTYFNRLRRLDAKVSYALTSKVSVLFEAQNLNDEPSWEYMGGRPEWVIGYERYGATYYAGISARW